MRLDLTEEQAAWKQQFREFAEKNIIPFADGFEQVGRIPTSLIDALGAERYLAPMVPSTYGGLGLDMVTIGILTEEVGRGCSSVRSLLTVHGMVATALIRWGTLEQREEWLQKLVTGERIGAFALSEAEAGSDASMVRSQAIWQENRFVLNGRKKWITFGQLADIYLVFADLNGQPSAFLVPRSTPGLEVTPISGMLGTSASMLAELSFTDCTLPESSLVGRPGMGITQIASTCLDYGRYSVAWGCVGIGQACLDHSLDYAGRRQQFGSYLKDFQLIQKMIAEMTVRLKAARWLCYSAGYAKDQRDPRSIIETWEAKYFASQAAFAAASDAVQIHGAAGCMPHSPVQRFFRDAKVMEIIEGTTQMNEILIATNTFQTGS